MKVPTRREDKTMDALLIKVPEAAAQLGISRAKLYEVIASGALRAVKVDGCRRSALVTSTSSWRN